MGDPPRPKVKMKTYDEMTPQERIAARQEVAVKLRQEEAEHNATDYWARDAQGNKLYLQSADLWEGGLLRGVLRAGLASLDELIEQDAREAKENRGKTQA